MTRDDPRQAAAEPGRRDRGPRRRRSSAGAWGRRAGAARRSWWTPVRILLAATLFTLAARLRAEGAVRDRRLDGLQAVHAHVLLRRRPAVERRAPGRRRRCPYRDTAVEYPVLTGGFMWFTAELTRGAARVRERLDRVVLFGVRHRAAARALRAGRHRLDGADRRAPSLRRRAVRAVAAAGVPRVLELGPAGDGAGQRGAAGRGRARNRSRPACSSGSGRRRSSTRCSC